MSSLFSGHDVCVRRVVCIPRATIYTPRNQTENFGGTIAYRSSYDIPIRGSSPGRTFLPGNDSGTFRLRSIHSWQLKTPTGVVRFVTGPNSGLRRVGFRWTVWTRTSGSPRGTSLNIPLLESRMDRWNGQLSFVSLGRPSRGRFPRL